MTRLNSYKRTPENFGLIHNDLHQGNFHIENEEIILYDFDDCSYNFFAQDLAVSIYHALWTGTSFHPEWRDFPRYFLSHFFEGYTSRRKLSTEIHDQLKVSMQMRELFLYLLFQEKWEPSSLEDWQTSKLIELRVNLSDNRIPYEKVLDSVKYFFN